MNKIIDTVEEVREYVQKDYWVTGQSSGKSGYENFHIDWGWNTKLLRHLNEAFNIQGLRVLDLGCAYGQVVAAMHKSGIDARGIDISDFAIDAGIKEYRPLNGRIFQGSCHDLSMFGNESFDFLYSNQVFEHIPQQYCRSLAHETYRVATAGSTIWAGLVLDLHSSYQPQGYSPKDPDKTHINLRPKIWWDNKFTEAGWEPHYDADKAFRAIRIDGYSYFEEYGWHSICYRKP